MIKLFVKFLTGFTKPPEEILFSVYVSVSFFLFSRSKERLIKAYLDTIQMTLVMHVKDCLERLHIFTKTGSSKDRLR